MHFASLYAENLVELLQHIVLKIILQLAHFFLIKFIFEYGPKWAEGKRPGNLFNYPYATTDHEHIGGLEPWKLTAARRGASLEVVSLPVTPDSPDGWSSLAGPLTECETTLPDPQ